MKIKSIKKNGVKPTWDLSIPKEEHYILKNGCVSHNSSNLLGLNEAGEPFVEIIYKRELSSGEFTVINTHLVKELEELGLWGEKLKNEIVLQESIQNIVLEKYNTELTRSIMEEKGMEYLSSKLNKIKRKYKTVYELGAKPIIELAASRQPFVDQTQSMNLWMKSPNGSKLTSMHLHSWKKKLKTGIYYLKQPSANSAQKSLGINVNKREDSSRNTDISCVGCSV